MNKYLKIAVICGMCFIAVACQSVSNKAFSKLGYEKIDQANQQIETVKADAVAQIAANNQKITDQNKIIADTNAQKDQNASNFLFNAEVAFSTISNPTRPETVINTNVQSASSFLPPPTTVAIQTALTEVKKELDEQLTSNADLTKKLQDAQTQAQVLNAQTQSAQTAITQLKTANDQIISATNDKVSNIQEAKDKTEQSLLSSQQTALNNAEDTKAMKMKIMWATGALALICIAGSIWSPVFKTQFIEGAALFGFMTLCIPYITGTILGIAGGIILFGILVTMGLQHVTAVKTIAASTNMPVATVAKAVANNTTALLVNDPIPSVSPSK